MATSTTLMLDEFLARPDTKPASELVSGEVIQKPMPDEDHSSIQGYLYMVIYQFLARTDLGKVGVEWRCVFGPSGEEDAFVPDVVFATHERRAIRGRSPRKFLWTAPDLAIEVLSPNQPAGPFADKLQFYLLHGVRLVWVIDPDERSIRIYRPGASSRMLRSGDTLHGDDVLPGFSVAVDDVFAQIEN
jgi:Uma2 family endonuclease